MNTSTYPKLPQAIQSTLGSMVRSRKGYLTEEEIDKVVECYYANREVPERAYMDARRYADDAYFSLLQDSQ
jgi:hypothetical protein